ncbi:hypothetical protein ACOME3_001475 [Neoechinorhynchus agilis]
MSCFLWHRNQCTLLEEIIGSGMEAVMVKVASIGLEPQKCIGKGLGEMFEHLKKLEKLYGCNVCGEGGEYETCVLYCPKLFKRRVILDEWDIVNAGSGAAYMHVKKAHLCAL